jgi:hypothetical protein
MYTRENVLSGFAIGSKACIFNPLRRHLPPAVDEA